MAKNNIYENEYKKNSISKKKKLFEEPKQKDVYDENKIVKITYYNGTSSKITSDESREDGNLKGILRDYKKGVRVNTYEGKKTIRKVEILD